MHREVLHAEVAVDDEVVLLEADRTEGVLDRLETLSDARLDPAGRQRGLPCSRRGGCRQSARPMTGGRPDRRHTGEDRDVTSVREGTMR